MKFYIPEQITIADSSIPQHTDVEGTVYSVWGNTVEYQPNTTVSHNGELFSSFRNIYPLATYSFSDPSATLTAEVIRLADGEIETLTAVPCVQDVTVVYVIDSWQDTTDPQLSVGKYFIFTGTTGNVDFTLLLPNLSTDFTEVINHRHENQEPIQDTSSIYWRYLGETNRNKVIGKSYNTQSIALASTEAWWEFEVTNPDKVTLFNIEAVSAKIVVYTTDINDPVFEDTIDPLLDTSSIVDWKTLVRYRNMYTRNADWTIPFLSGTYKIRVYLLSPTPIDLKLGEILTGQTVDYGLTIDGLPIQVKSSGKITEKPNGDLVFEDEGDLSKVYTIFNFNVLYKSDTLDSTLDKSGALINRRVVVFGENTDDVKYRSLIIYGFTREASPTQKSNSSDSPIKFQVQRFK